LLFNIISKLLTNPMLPHHINMSRLIGLDSRVLGWKHGQKNSRCQGKSHFPRTTHDTWHIHNHGTPFWTQDSRTSFLLSSIIKYKWNKFKWEILNNSNYDHFHGGGIFSHAYAIMHTYFGKNKNANNEYISFYMQLNMFSCMKISCTFC